jgi:transposase-like protein
MVYKKLSDEDRRRMIVRALGPDAANMTRIAQSYGITRRTLYSHVYRATKDPEGKWREAQEEASFRRKVYELTR